MPSDCVFCEIVAGRSPASFVQEGDEAVAFMDIGGVNEGHTLVVPRRHATLLGELDTKSAAAVWSLGLRVAAAVRRSGLRCEGVNLLLSDGEAAGQEVFHVHLHVLPRWAGDGFGFRRPARDRDDAPRAELDEAAARIHTALG
jgi:histidine triad (HIT) family protein